MNGALFGSMKVISNFVHMTSCNRTKHPWYRQIGMVLFLIYYTTNFLFQFFTVGAMYSAITIFVSQELAKAMEMSGYYGDSNFIGMLLNKGIIQNFFIYFYLSLLLLTLVISLTTPVDKGIVYYSFLMAMFGILLCISMAGIIFYLIKSGFMPETMEYHLDDG